MFIKRLKRGNEVRTRMKPGTHKAIKRSLARWKDAPLMTSGSINSSFCALAPDNQSVWQSVALAGEMASVLLARQFVMQP